MLVREGYVTHDQVQNANPSLTTEDAYAIQYPNKEFRVLKVLETSHAITKCSGDFAVVARQTHG